MAPAPLCKTAILSFIIDETITKFWNVSSISRKRAQMIVRERHVVVRKYNVNALKINGWVKVEKYDKYINRAEEIKKGVFNYWLDNQEQVERVISLNGKLRCYGIAFQPKVPLEVDYIECLTVDQDNFDYYLKCSFNQASNLIFKGLSSSQINQIMDKFKQINDISINECSIPSLDLSSRKINRISFFLITFSEKIDLPSNLDYLDVFECIYPNFLNPRKVKEIDYCRNGSFDPIKKCKGLKIAGIKGELSEFMNYLPSTTRELKSFTTIDAKNIDLADLKKKFPFLINIDSETPIEICQALNLRAINPMIKKAEETFTYRPRSITVNYDNVEQLNKHPELFEKLEKVWIRSDKFNFDYLPVGIKEIGFGRFGRFEVEGKKLESLEKNNWKFEKTNVKILRSREDEIQTILNSLAKVIKIETDEELKYLEEDYPQFKFTQF